MKKYLKVIGIMLAFVIVVAGCGSNLSEATGIEDVSSDYVDAYLALDFDNLLQLSIGEQRDKMQNLQDNLKDTKVKRKVEKLKEEVKVVEENEVEAVVEVLNRSTITESFLLKKDYKETFESTYRVTLTKVEDAWKVSNLEEISTKKIAE